MNWNDIILAVMPYTGILWAHFVFSGCVGALGYWLMQTTYYGALRIFHYTASLTMAQKRFMVWSGLCFALALAWCGHMYLDSVHHWWTQPLAPPLVINTDPGRYNP